MAYASWSVSFGEQPSAAKWNILGTNDAAFNDGTGIGTNAIAAASLATNAITLGYASTTSTFSSASTGVLITGLSVTVTIPAGGRRVKITGYVPWFTQTTSNTGNYTMIYDGVLGSGGTKISQSQVGYTSAGGTSWYGGSVIAIAIQTPSAGSKTYQYCMGTSGGTLSAQADTTYPAFILVEAI